MHLSSPEQSLLCEVQPASASLPVFSLHFLCRDVTVMGLLQTRPTSKNINICMDGTGRQGR